MGIKSSKQDLSRDSKGRFQLGKPSWNKGRKWTRAERKKLSLARMNSKFRTGPLHPRWKTGLSMTYQGYWRNNLTRRSVHVEVLEKKIGRRLKSSEVAHHKNGIKTDNRPCNLMVMSRRKHFNHHIDNYH